MKKILYYSFLWVTGILLLFFCSEDKPGNEQDGAGRNSQYTGC